MNKVKILRKGRITLPKNVRDSLGVREGNVLIIETTQGEVFIKKGKTIHDVIGVLPNLGMTIDEIREQAAKTVAEELTSSCGY